MELLTIEEVAAILKVKPKTVGDWLRAGKLPGVKLGDGRAAEWRVNKADLEDYVRERTTQVRNPK